MLNGLFPPLDCIEISVSNKHPHHQATGGLEPTSTPCSTISGRGLRCLPSTPLWEGLSDGRLTGLADGFLTEYSRSGEDGRESAIETLRETAEKGGGRVSCGEENMNSLPVLAAASPCERDNVDSASTG
jgi:hypothetical protein